MSYHTMPRELYLDIVRILDNTQLTTSVVKELIFKSNFSEAIIALNNVQSQITKKQKELKCLIKILEVLDHDKKEESKKDTS